MLFHSLVVLKAPNLKELWLFKLLFFFFRFHYFLFLPWNLPKMTYIELLKSPQNDIFWSAEISSEGQYSWRVFLVRREVPNIFLESTDSTYNSWWFSYKKCIEMCHFGEIFRFWTTKYYLFMVKTYDSKISPKWHCFCFESEEISVVF